ncbi:MAG TPA: alpha-(1-_3)-arabinofuranosyltransferase family protein, partial [Acidimicrobiales bacterium]|nr:alpha-(1->3)-arabinofuranosyltransferase family protein [Acidimicrobiales bacterium]
MLVLALVAYVPLLLTEPGAVGADTKAHLYTDPAKLLSRAWSLWDPNIGLGTVTHQNIGFLFPVGPYYWVMDTLGFPDWVAQRIWLGSILFLAGLGARALGKHLGLAPTAATVAGLVFMLSPYTLAYAARISVILLPWAALPWMVLLAARAAERGGWRDPARFALVVALVGGVNATALVLAGLGPVIWLIAAVVTGRVTARAAATAAARIGALTTGVSLWWLGALAVQGQYGIPILQYSETAQTVASTSLANEVWRGLGYWFLYGEDRLGPWIEPGQAYTQRLWLLAASYALPVLGLAVAGVVRWSARVALGILAVVGLVIAVGAYPWETPSPIGWAFRGLLSTDAGLAFRSLPRAAPLLVLAVALFLGAGITALGAAAPRRGRWAAAGVAALALVVQVPLFTGQLVDENLQRPEELPAYWREAAAHLDARGHDTRVLEVPGADFASYRWGNTVDPISSGLMDRPTAYRELIPYGSPAAADLLIAIDRRMQEGVFEPESLAPVARLLGVGDILYRADLQFERFRTPRPRWLGPLLDAAPGLGDPVDFGLGIPNEPVPEVPMLDDLELALDPGISVPAALRAYPVLEPVPILRRHPTDATVVLAGDGDGIVDAAAAGLLDGDELVVYSASITTEPARVDQLLDDDAVLIVTDTNRLRSHRWNTVRENRGVTERVGDAPLEDDPTDNRLEIAPGARDDAHTVAADLGGVNVRATSYGNGVSYTPEFRARNAVDGDLRTAWRTAAGRGVEDERILIELDEPAAADEITLVQAFDGANRWITEIELTVDDADPVRVALDETSRSAPGQTVPLGVDRFERIEIELIASDAPGALGASEVGFAEIEIPGVTADEVIVLPRDLLGIAGDRAIDHHLAVVLTRLRVHPSEAVRRDEELALDRIIELPSARDVALDGVVRLSGWADDPVVDAALGLPGVDEGGITATSSRRLFGDPTARASSAIDGDPSTWWSPAFTDPRGDWIQLELAEPVTVEQLALAVVADGRHSVPTALVIENEAGERRRVELPAIADGAEPNAVTEVTVPVEAISGQRLRVIVDDVREVATIDWFG